MYHKFKNKQTPKKKQKAYLLLWDQRDLIGKPKTKELRAI